MSQLQLVHSGYHTHFIQYTDNSRRNASVLQYSRNEVFQYGRLNESSNKANAYKFQYVCATLCAIAPVLRRGAVTDGKKTFAGAKVHKIFDICK